VANLGRTRLVCGLIASSRSDGWVAAWFACPTIRRTFCLAVFKGGGAKIAFVGCVQKTPRRIFIKFRNVHYGTIDLHQRSVALAFFFLCRGV
jgi:hypothetical protein